MKLTYPKFDLNVQKKVQKVLATGRVNYWTGNECKLFEKEFSKYLKNRYSIAVSNGSVALEIALKSLELKKGDQIIVTSRSFIISASCVINLGLKPIFADVDDNGNLDIKSIKLLYNQKVKALIIVHLNGLACEMDPILSFVKEKKLFLIEDSSQAHGAVYKGNKVGSFGDISTWSFCQDKIISTGGEGGMISTNNKFLFLKLWSLKEHGKNYVNCFTKKNKIGFRWLHDYQGSNYRMTEMQAVIGREQLKKLDNQIKKRNLIASIYVKELKDFYQKYKIIKQPDFKCKSCPFKTKKQNCNKCRHAFYRLNLFIDKNKINQKDLLKQLAINKIDCGVGACPEIYKEKIFIKLKLNPKKRLPNAKLLGETSIMFPINPYRSLMKIKSEIRTIKKIFNNFL